MLKLQSRELVCGHRAQVDNCHKADANRTVWMSLGANLTTFTYSDFGALETEITGSQTTTYTYDGQDQLVGVLPHSGVLSTYTFDGDGMRRTAQEGNVQPTTMVWDGSDYLFLDGPSSDQLVLTLGGEIVACGSKDLLTDPLGSLVREISSGASLSSAFGFYPYGSPVLPMFSPPTIPFRYIAAWGYFFDTNDRDYVRARELEKRLGRWMQTDPLWPGERAFGYVGGSPIQFVDPTGTAIPILVVAAVLYLALQELDDDCGRCQRKLKPLHEATSVFGLSRKSDRINALGHCMVSCLVKRHAPECMYWHQTILEGGSNFGHASSIMDRWNNSIGFALALKKGSCKDLCESHEHLLTWYEPKPHNWPPGHGGGGSPPPHGVGASSPHTGYGGVPGATGGMRYE